MNRWEQLYCELYIEEKKEVEKIMGRTVFNKFLPHSVVLSYVLLYMLRKGKDSGKGYLFFKVKAETHPKGNGARIFAELGPYYQQQIWPRNDKSLFKCLNLNEKNEMFQGIMSKIHATAPLNKNLIELILNDIGDFFSRESELFYPPPSHIVDIKIIPSSYPLSNLLEIWSDKVNEIRKKVPTDKELIYDGLDFIAKIVERNSLQKNLLQMVLHILMNGYAREIREKFSEWLENGKHIESLQQILEVLNEPPLVDRLREDLKEIGQNILRNLKSKSSQTSLSSQDQKIKELACGLTFEPVHLEELKLLDYYTKYITLNRKPFKDYIVVAILHFLRDLVPFVEALKRLGASSENIILLCKPYPYAHRDALVTYFTYREKISVVTCEGEEVCDVEMGKLCQKISEWNGMKKVIIIEDGGYIGPYICQRATNLLSRIKGAVEQTTKGFREYEIINTTNLNFPVVNVAKSNFKRNYEAPLIGRAVVRNIRSMLPEKNLNGCYALIIGFGSIGKEVAKCLYWGEGMKIKVVEKDLDRQREARNSDYVKVVSENVTDEVIDNCILIVGTTGVSPSPINQNVIQKAENGAILLSASSDRKEIDILFLEKNLQSKKPIESEGGIRVGYKYKLKDNKEIIVLADGYPINFFVSESVPNESIDPILTLLLLSAVEIAENNIPNGIQTEKADEIVRKYTVEERLKSIYR